MIRMTMARLLIARTDQRPSECGMTQRQSVPKIVILAHSLLLLDSWPMNTIILQSFRNYDVPRWIELCIESVQRWADLESWDYEFLDDRFFEYAPGWVREKCRDNVYAVTDVCRLNWIQSKLDEGYDRVAWLDADVLVFDPSALSLVTTSGQGFAAELVLERQASGRFRAVHGINNAAMVFGQDRAVINTYLQACLSVLDQCEAGRVPRAALGPDLLKRLDQQLDLERLPGFGLLPPRMLKELARGVPRLLAEMIKRIPNRIGGANLCHFVRNARPAETRDAIDVEVTRAVEMLLETEGACLYEGLEAL